MYHTGQHEGVKKQAQHDSVLEKVMEASLSLIIL